MDAKTFKVNIYLEIIIDALANSQLVGCSFYFIQFKINLFCMYGIHF